MTPQEALNHFEEHLCKHCCEWDKSLRHCDSCPTDTAKKALEKQIPKKPIYVGDTDIFDYVCPTCGQLVYELFDFYCSQCGQKLTDWSEVE